MAEIAGSVWNANNWHWEEKNYTKWGKERLDEILSSFRYTIDLPNSEKYEFGIQSSTIKGEASISVRKKQPILAYEFEISGVWFVNEIESGVKQLEGQISIPEFSVDNYEDDFVINLACRECYNNLCDSTTILGNIKKKGIQELRKKIATFHALLLNNEGSQTKIESENLRRQEEQKTAEIARITKEDEKKMIYKQQIDKETENKKLQSKKEASTLTQQNNNVQGSVWNTGSWHWEEKPETNWVKKALTEKLENYSITMEIQDDSEISNFPITFRNIKVEGEASSSIRKGKKICVLDCTVDGEFNISILSEKYGEKIPGLPGKFSLSEINAMDTHDYLKKVSFDSTKFGILASDIPGFSKTKDKIEKRIISILDDKIQEFCLEFLNK
ncbi:Hch1p like mystery [Cryptosporidium xiaoi]|uniref:Hch1p like mystery n=1 Tax=Cryptosporidium xiaoi TaxID=659607 RepID=A0AAV9Y0K3_9CRYT